MRYARISFLMPITVMLFICLGYLFPYSGQAAEKEPAIQLNGTHLDLPQAVIQVEQSIMIPIRVVSEQLGYKVSWEDSTQLISIHSNDHSIQLTVNHKEAIVNNQMKLLDVPATVQQQTTFVPLRFVGESMGLNVIWDNDTKTVHIEEPPDLSDSSTTEGLQDNVITALSYSNSILTITSQQNVEPKITVLNHPNRIVLDYANTVFSDEISLDYQLDVSGSAQIAVTDNANVRQIRFSIFSQAPDPNAVRFVIETAEELAYTVQQDEVGTFSINLASLTTDDNTNAPSIPNHVSGPTIDDENEPDHMIPVTTPNHNDQYVIVIDAGHGGSDGGAESIHNRLEKEFTLSTALKVAELARQESKLQVLLTRSEDVYPTLTERVDFAIQSNAHLFVSIHGNSVDGLNPVPNGTETYYYHEESEAFAKLMHSYLVEATGFQDRGYKQADHRVTHYTTMPAILLEVGFLSNPDNELLMFTDEFQWRVATHILNGIKAQLELQ